MATEAQGLYLRMLELTSVNNLDGPRVARDLRDNAGIWRSVLFVRVGMDSRKRGKFSVADEPLWNSKGNLTA